MNLKKYFLFFSVLLFLVNFHVSFAQDVTLYTQFNGRYDYTAFGNTLNTTENGFFTPCVINTTSSAELVLEDDDVIEAAYLYWAGSGTGDFDITLNGNPITAERTFSDSLDATRVFFAAFADITDLILAEGEGIYTISDFDLTGVIPPFCPSGTNFGGWAVTVIYRNDALPLNQVNVYDGLQSVPEILEITLDSLNVFDNEGAKIGFVAWEGDQNLSVTETLFINGNIIGNPPLNPEDNAFNGTNSFTGASNLYNMDIDFYGIQDYISIGDTSATIRLTSGQDFVMINNVITVLNSRLPDATITINNVITNCNSYNIIVNYTVSNLNSTDTLPTNTPITFYLNDTVLGSATTGSAIPIDGTLTQSISFTIPDDVPTDFLLTASVDDIGDGTGVVAEIIETNNTHTEAVSLIFSPEVGISEDILICGELEDIVFDLTVVEDQIEADTSSWNIIYYETLADAITEINAITSPENYVSASESETIYARVTDTSTSCHTIAIFGIRTSSNPEVNQPEDIIVCQENTDFTYEFDLTINDAFITTEEDVTITYYESITSSDSLENMIVNPETFTNTTNPQTIYAEVVDDLGCSSRTSFTLLVEPCDVEIPSGFSPNEDGKNDTFSIVNLEAYPNHEYKIYNRLGTLVYEGNRNIPQWNGYANKGINSGQRLPNGTYFYVLDLNSSTIESVKQHYAGWVYLTR